MRFWSFHLNYWTDFNPNKKQIDFLNPFISSLQLKFHFRYIDMQFDKDFEDNDFYNETHLSELGAEKFTKKYNDLVF